MSIAAYGQVSWLDKIKTILTLLPLPVVTLWRLLLSPYVSHDRRKTWKRVMTDASFRCISASLSVNQMQHIMGTTLRVCEKWAKQHMVVLEVDETGEGARMIWLGEKRTEKVILYVHGGTYCLPIQDFALSFWNYVIKELKHSRDFDLGFVALNYTLVPTAPFPAQLKQAISALHYLLSLGVQPANLQIVGESAGAGLILQLLSHMLHPLPSLAPSAPASPFLPSGTKLRGILLMSPWVSLTGDTGSHLSNSASDVLPASTWAYLGSHYLPFVPGPERAYVEAAKVPEGWFAGLDGLVERVLVTARERECLRDDVLRFAGGVKRVLRETVVVVQEDGVHNDQYLDFLAGESPKKGSLTPIIVQWLSDGFCS